MSEERAEPNAATNVKADSSPLPTPPPHSFGNLSLFWGVLLILSVVFAYQPAWRAGFVWDDDIMLTENRFVKAPDGLRAIWFSTKLPDYFPMTSTALWLQWRVWGNHATGYHLVNIFLHALGAVMLWRVMIRLKVRGAWFAAALFALHPVNVESVAWITELKNTLSMVFYAVSVYSFLRFEDSEQRRWYGVALGAFALALLSKTAVAPLPVVLLGLAWWRRSRVERRDIWRTIPFFALAGALAAVTLWFHHHRPSVPLWSGTMAFCRVSPERRRQSGFTWAKPFCRSTWYLFTRAGRSMSAGSGRMCQFCC
jgi:protein O-mannosyl-transferase